MQKRYTGSQETGSLFHRALAIFLAFIFTTSLLLPATALAATPTVKIFDSTSTRKALNRPVEVGTTKTDFFCTFESGFSAKTITWTSDAPTIAKITGSGTKATVAALKEGCTSIRVKVVTTSGATVTDYCYISAYTKLTSAAGSLKVASTIYRSAINTSYSQASVPAKTALTVSRRCGTYYYCNFAPKTYTFVDGVTTSYLWVPVANVTVPIASVKISKTSLSLAAGKVSQLSATITPDYTTDSKTLTWTSNKAAVATVSSTGLVTAKAAGTATITVKSSNGKTATCACTVASVPVTAVKLNKTTSTLTVGGTEQLTATITPTNATNKTVIWTSSAPATATVSPTGLVSALATGTVTITVKTSDGGKTATCVYTISTAPIAVTSVVLNKTTSTLSIGASEQLIATVKPTNATNKTVKWTSSSPSIVTVSATGKVTAKAAGTATITVTTDDGAKTATCKYTVTAMKLTLKSSVCVAGTANVAKNTNSFTYNAVVGATSYKVYRMQTSNSVLNRPGFGRDFCLSL